MAKRLSDNTSKTLKTQLKTLSDEPVVSDEIREQTIETEVQTNVVPGSK